MVDYLLDRGILSICNWSCVHGYFHAGSLAGALSLSVHARLMTNYNSSAIKLMGLQSFCKEKFVIPYGLVAMHHALQGKHM